MYDPNGDIASMVSALRQPAQGTQVAGETIPFPIIGNANTGNTPLASQYLGKAPQGNVYPIPLDVLRAWMERVTSRPR